MERSIARRAFSALGGFAAAALLAGLAAIPGMYLMTWAFRLFLVDAVFTGRIPSPPDMAFFCFFLGAALLLWGLGLTFLLALLPRLLRRFPRADGPRKAAKGYAEKSLLPLLPFPWARDLFRRIAGPD